jgi:hypothetical protein
MPHLPHSVTCVAHGAGRTLSVGVAAVTHLSSMVRRRDRDGLLPPDYLPPDWVAHSTADALSDATRAEDELTAEVRKLVSRLLSQPVCAQGAAAEEASVGSLSSAHDELLAGKSGQHAAVAYALSALLFAAVVALCWHFARALLADAGGQAVSQWASF